MAPILTVEMYTPGEIVDSRRSTQRRPPKARCLLAKRGSPMEIIPRPVSESWTTVEP
jgi:hypothetical protein